MQAKNKRIWCSQVALLLTLLVSSKVSALNIAIKENKIFVDGKEVPLGVHPDATYYQVFGTAPFRDLHGDLVWDEKGVVLMRRGDDPNCMVIARFYLRPEFGYASADTYIQEIKAVNKPVLVEGVALTSERGLPELKAATARWAEKSPFGYTYNRPGGADVSIMVVGDYHNRKFKADFVDVTINDFDKTCGDTPLVKRLKEEQARRNK